MNSESNIGMKFAFSLESDIGRRRKQNQDRGCARPDLGLFLVADGMGGHQGGETASSMAVELIPRFLSEFEKRESEFRSASALTASIQSANRDIFRLSQKESTLHGMGTTTTAMLFKDNHLSIGHVGDSRAYFFRPEAMWQLTRDHSLVQEKLRAGLISRQDVEKDSARNVITRSVGFEPDVFVEMFEMEIQTGDLFLMCSDGLSSQVEDSKILEIVQKWCFEKSDIQGAVKNLVEAANQAGGDDNVTVLVVQVLPS